MGVSRIPSKLNLSPTPRMIGSSIWSRPAMCIRQRNSSTSPLKAPERAVSPRDASCRDDFPFKSTIWALTSTKRLTPAWPIWEPSASRFCFSNGCPQLETDNSELGGGKASLEEPSRRGREAIGKHVQEID